MSKHDLSLLVPRIITNDFDFLAEPRTQSTPVTEPLVADLLVAYAFDYPQFFRIFSHGDMDEHGLTVSEVRAAAMNNLRTRSVEVQGNPPVLMMFTGDHLEAALLLLDRLWESVREAVASSLFGEMVVAVPTRDTVLLTGSGSPEGLQVVREMVVESQEQVKRSHRLTQHLLVRRDGKWEVFDG